MSRAFQVAVAFDQLINALFGGYADETMSARVWRCRKEEPYTDLLPIIDRVFFWQRDHCHAAYWSEVLRSQLPREYSDV